MPDQDNIPTITMNSDEFSGSCLPLNIEALNVIFRQYTMHYGFSAGRRQGYVQHLSYLSPVNCGRQSGPLIVQEVVLRRIHPLQKKTMKLTK